jgi:ATP-dependent Zn protease
VASIAIEGPSISGHFNGTETIRGMSIRAFHTQIPKEAVGWQFTQWLLEHRGNAIVNVDNNANVLLDILVPLIPWLLIFGFIWFFVFRQLRHRQPQIPFDDYRSPQPPTAPPSVVRPPSTT